MENIHFQHIVTHLKMVKHVIYQKAFRHVLAPFLLRTTKLNDNYI